jgi:heat shock protein HslJ
MAAVEDNLRMQFHRTLLLMSLPFVCDACSTAIEGQSTASPTNPTRAGSPPPSSEELRNLTYAGVDERFGPFTLRNGRWEGTPAAPGAASRPVVQLAEPFRVNGDLDGDDVEDAVVALSYSTGGSGGFTFLALVTRASGALRNRATVALGDRVQIRSAVIDRGRLLVSTVRAGAQDAACCPGDLVDLAWMFRDGQFAAAAPVITGRLSPGALGRSVWVLHEWDVDQPAPVEPAVTLAYDAGRFSGSSGCNRYTAFVATGVTPGAVSVGPAAGTRMACPDPQSRTEARFLDQLGGAQSIGFMLGRLAIGYARRDGTRGTMLFTTQANPAP